MIVIAITFTTWRISATGAGAGGSASPGTWGPGVAGPPRGASGRSVKWANPPSPDHAEVGAPEPDALVGTRLRRLGDVGELVGVMEHEIPPLVDQRLIRCREALTEARTMLLHERVGPAPGF